MSDLAMRLLKLAEKGYSLNELSIELGLSHEQIYEIFRNLKQLGVGFERKYYYDGEIVYELKRALSSDEDENAINIFTSSTCKNFRAMIISDLHIGNKKQSIESWDKIYNYCAANGINIIIITGDFIDGMKIGDPFLKMHKHPLEQMEYAIRNYPSDKNILNFTLLGNHDIDSLVSYGIDFATYLNNFRHDIIPIGYGFGTINVKNEKIFVMHPLSIGKKVSIDLPDNYLLLKGHKHYTKSFIGSNGNCSLTVPSLSNLFLSEETFLPGAMVLDAEFHNGYFNMLYIENLLINQRVSIASSMRIEVAATKEKKHSKKIKYEEDRVKKKVLNKV